MSLSRISITLAAAAVVLTFTSLATAQDVPLPDAVAKAADSVFRYIPLRLGQDGERATLEQRQNAFTSTCTTPESFLVKLRCDFMRDECPKSGDCFIPFVVSGSAFVIGDGDTLISAFHVVGDAEVVSLLVLGPAMSQFPQARLKQIYANYQADFLLYDRDDHLVYDTRKYSTPHRYEKMGEPLQAMGITTDASVLPAELAKFGSDYARIHLRRKIALGLKSGLPAPVAASEPNWALGFPGKTNRADHNYDGFQFYINPGLRYEWSDIAKVLNFPVTPGLDTFPLFITTNDIVGGFSGGPMLNQNGEVTGILTGTYSDESTFRGIAVITKVRRTFW